MKSAFAVFERNVAELRWFIESLDRERSVLKHLANCEFDSNSNDDLKSWCEHLSTSATTKRRFDYTSIVISLYGILEHFIEGIVIGYTKELNALFLNFDDLPAPVKNIHVELSMSLMNRIKQGRHKGVATESSVVADLHSCLTNGSPYNLNHDAFAYHTSNFRIQSIDDMLSRIGITNVSQRLIAYPPLSDYLAFRHQGRDLQSIPSSETFFLIDDLAERRNEVAHGPVSQLLGHEILLEYIEFVENFGGALFELVYGSSIEHVSKLHGVNLGSPIAVHNHNIVCIRLDGHSIEVGDMLIASTGDAKRPLRFGVIETLEVDSQRLTHVSGTPEGVNVGIKVPFRSKSNHLFSHVPKSKWP